MSNENGSIPLRKNKKESGGILMTIILICITVAILLATLVVYERQVQENVEIFNISLNVYDGKLDTEYDRWNPETMTYRPYIQNISIDAVLEQGIISAVEAPRDTPLQLPGVVARAFNADTGVAISYWTSLSYEGADTYDLTISFFEPPEKGDRIKIILEIVDSHGDDMFPYYNEDLANSSITYVWE